MPSLPKIIKPTNRHITIVPHFIDAEEECRKVLLPDDYKPKQEKFMIATVMDVAPDCAVYFQKLKRGTNHIERQIVVDSSMIERVQILGKDYYLILENYVLGTVEAQL